ncbi:general secretion pathway protein J [Yersinia aldovae]|uniref:type II secretion system minor pseudopilin GspJ n=1 Tax=Yersinia aldovae TaxID=29483 RepID=UPI0005DE915B|nr:type II secretion system minor pseudopilin GspJ [Yersinia aldovae]CNI12264.1 general secretion pathway protein J [Yersinia aldovae]
MVSRFSYGFTLLETLLAIIIFTLMSLTVYQSLQIVMKSSATIKNKTHEKRKILEVIDAIEQDITHVTEYCQKTESQNKESHPIYLLNRKKNIIDFISLSQTETVSYRFKNKTLERVVYVKPERLKPDKENVSMLLDGVTDFNMRVYYNGKWLNEWCGGNVIPQAVEVIIKFKNYGLLRRVIIPLNYKEKNETVWHGLVFCSLHNFLNELTDLYIT